MFEPGSRPRDSTYHQVAWQGARLKNEMMLIGSFLRCLIFDYDDDEQHESFSNKYYSITMKGLPDIRLFDIFNPRIVAFTPLEDISCLNFSLRPLFQLKPAMEHRWELFMVLVELMERSDTKAAWGCGKVACSGNKTSVSFTKIETHDIQLFLQYIYNDATSIYVAFWGLIIHKSGHWSLSIQQPNGPLRNLLYAVTINSTHRKDFNSFSPNFLPATWMFLYSLAHILDVFLERQKLVLSFG